MSQRLRIDPTACSGHGLCAELLPEQVTLDEWGYPILADQPVPARLRRAARRAVTACPALALRLAPVPAPPGSGRGGPAGQPQRPFRANSEVAQNPSLASRATLDP